MKKINFYSLMRRGGVSAVLHKGYTDGTYNYYKNGSQWYVILPNNGLSVLYDNTLKGATEKAHSPEMIKKIGSALNAYGPAATQRFNDAIKRLRKAAQQ